jgi:hypothetical protein
VERGRCFSPTSATDVRHEHPCHRPTAERAGFTLGERCVDPADPSPPTKAGANDPRCARPPCGDPTPADPRIDGAVPASILPVHTDRCPRLPPLGREPRRGPKGPRRRTVVGCGAAARATSDVSVSRTLANDRRCDHPSAYVEDRLHRRLVKGDSLRRPETPSIGRCSLDPCFRPSPSQILVGSLSPCPSLCREGAGFRGPFVDLCSREG